MTTIIIELTEEDMKKIEGISSLYDVIALAIEPEADVENLLYDCTKICVSSGIWDRFFNRMEQKGYTKADVAMYWCIHGPKVDEKLTGLEVEIYEGFFHSNSSKAN